MSIPVSFTARKNPLRPQDPPLFYAKTQYRSIIDMERMASDIAYATSLTPGDVYNVLRNIPTYVKLYASNGDMVDLGGLGKFCYHVSSKGAETRADFNRHLIKRVKFQFTPGPLMIENLNNLKFEEVLTRDEYKAAMRQAKQTE